MIPHPPVRFDPAYYDYYAHEYSYNDSITYTKINNNNTLDDDDDKLEPIEDNDPDEEQENNATTPPTADELVSASLRNGALVAVCDIEDTTRAVDEEEKRIQ